MAFLPSWEGSGLAQSGGKALRRLCFSESRDFFFFFFNLNVFVVGAVSQKTFVLGKIDLFVKGDEVACDNNRSL